MRFSLTVLFSQRAYTEYSTREHEMDTRPWRERRIRAHWHVWRINLTSPALSDMSPLTAFCAPEVYLLLRYGLSLELEPSECSTRYRTCSGCFGERSVVLGLGRTCQCKSLHPMHHYRTVYVHEGLLVSAFQEATFRTRARRIARCKGTMDLGQ